jgi:protoheme IX farnesyltransferase
VAVAAVPEDLAPAVEATPTARSWASVVRAYFLLTKPRVIELLLVTTVPAMVLAEDGIPALGLIGAVLLGGALSAGGANTINCWIERDRDQVMRRTHSRPLPAGDVSPTAALVFGLVLEAVAFVWLTLTVNLLSAALSVSAMLFYVFVYTIWLKPRSPQNIVIGGAAGAVPALVGWASVTNSLSASAWVMFAIVFCWTPPHFWALSVRYREDYAKAGIPMLPVVVGTAAAARQILVYAIVTVVVSFALVPVADLGWIYGIASLVLGVMFVVGAAGLLRRPTPEAALKLFHFSNTYLALLFVAIAADVIVRAG